MMFSSTVTSRRKALHRQADGGAVRHSVYDAGAGRGAVALAGAARGQLPPAGRAESHPQGAGDGRARQALRPRKPADCGQLPLGLLLSGARAEPQCGQRSAADCQGAESGPGAVARHACAATAPARSIEPIPIKQDVTADEQAFIEAHRNELPELETIDVERRLYPSDGFAAHLIGYVGEVSEEDLNNPRFASNDPGDIVGKAGASWARSSRVCPSGGRHGSPACRG